MTALFGGKDDGQDDVAAMNAEIERVDSLSLQQLAAEVMIKGSVRTGLAGRVSRPRWRI